MEVRYAYDMVKVVKEKYFRSSLSQHQIRLLELVFKYRFVSRNLVAESLGIKPENGLHDRLEVLVKRGSLAKRFEKHLKLDGVPAAYYLTPQGLRELRELPKHEHVTESLIKACYRDKTVGMAFVIHTLNVYKYTNILLRSYQNLKIFTARELTSFSYFPKQLPDAVLSIASDSIDAEPQRFFFDLVSDSTPRSSLDNRLAIYCQFFDVGGWEAVSENLPTLLLLSEWSPAEKRIQRIAKARLSRSDMEELEVYTSTTAALESMAHQTAIWSSLEDPEELTELTNI